MQVNPSGIYTLTMSVRADDGAVVKDSYEPYVVIDGQRRQMKASDIGRKTFDYEFFMPEGFAEASYYFELDYSVDHGGTVNEKTVKSELYKLRLIDRYVLQLSSVRGPVGSRIAIVGNGFTPEDAVLVSGFRAETTFDSPNSLTFVVPALNENRSHPIEVLGPSGSQLAGQFFIDASRMKVSPGEIKLLTNERKILAIAIDFDAPEGGLPIQVKTDIPLSIIMPEVVIAPGTSSISVPVKGGKPGKGALYLNAPGFNQVVVPLNVASSQAGLEDLPPAPPAEEEQETMILEP